MLLIGRKIVAPSLVGRGGPTGDHDDESRRRLLPAQPSLTGWPGRARGREGKMAMHQL